MKKYVAEFVGSFFLSLIALLVINNRTGSMAPIALGSIFTALIWSGQRISGAHFNPVVTLALFLRRRLSKTDILYYSVAQLFGGLVASVMAGFLLRCGAAAEIDAFRLGNSICTVMAEFFGVFILCTSALNAPVETDMFGEETPSERYALTMGLSLAAVTYAFGSISGGVFNPAFALAGTITGNFDAGDLWMYLISALIGAAAAATVAQLFEE